jgi:hypothetical protein
VRVSHSELTTYLTCPRKHHHAYRDRRVSRVKSDALTTGSRVDTALKNEPVDLSPLEHALVDGYRARWRKHPLNETAQGVRFEVEAKPGLMIVGEFDALGIDENGDEFIIERKTTSDLGAMFWHRFLKLDPQVSTYLMARPAAKYVLVDALKKSTLRGKKDETDLELYERAAEAIANNIDSHYQRRVIVRFPHEHSAHMRDVLGTVRLIQIADEDARFGAMPPRNTKACMNYGSPCEYLPCCDGSTTIKDDLRYKEKTHG